MASGRVGSENPPRWTWLRRGFRRTGADRAAAIQNRRQNVPAVHNGADCFTDPETFFVHWRHRRRIRCDLEWPISPVTRCNQ
jgi:hypothetical protein